MTETNRADLARGTLALVLIIALSFALGYLFAGQTAIAPIVIEKCSQP